MKNELIKLQAEYINLLGDELSKHEEFMINTSGWTPKEDIMNKAKSMRDRMDNLRKSIDEETTPKSIEQRIEWISKRSPLSPITKDYLGFQMRRLLEDEPSHQTMRDLVDVVWSHIYEDESVPSTQVADELIQKVKK